MRTAEIFIALAIFALAAACMSPERPEAPAPDAGLLKLGVDSTSPIESRIRPVPTEVVRSYASFQKATLTDRVLTDAQREKVAAAVAMLTPLQVSVLRKHLRSISFADGMPNNAQTARVLSSDYLAFDIVFNANVLDETVSEFLSRKEAQLFDTSGSPLSVAIDGGSMDAIVYLLLHEAAHGVDMLLELTPQTAPFSPIPDERHTPLSRGVWETARMPVEAYRDDILDSIPWRSGSKPLPIDRAKVYYDALRETPFVSAYATTLAPEDAAELVAWRQLSQNLKQPYRVEIRNGSTVIYSYEPMKSHLVQSRLKLLDHFDSR